MKFIYKLLFALNSIVALALLLAYLLPFIPPRYFSALAVLSLFLPGLIVLNFCFLVFWIITLKRYFLLPLIVLLLGFGHIKSLFHFHPTADAVPTNGLKVMSYNVRLFNRYHWIKDNAIPQKIADFVINEDPDIVGFQEFFEDPSFSLPSYPHRYKRSKKGESGQAIYSKWPIVKTGHLQFLNSGNNAIFTDIVINKDTLRVFNAHLESLKLDVDDELDLTTKKNKKLLNKIGGSFIKQEEQVDELIEAITVSPHKVIVLADLNNTSSSYVYRVLNKRLNDTFKIAGKGFGKTFELKGFPLRIDVILPDPSIKVLKHQNFDVELSDHFPIMAEIKLD